MKIKALSLLIALCLVVGMLPASAFAATGDTAVLQGIEEYPALEYDADTEITISGTETVYATFTPAADGWYRFTTNGDFDTVGNLFDAEMNQIGYNDDCHEDSHAHEYGMNFCISAELQGGVTYVLSIRFWGDNWGIVPIHVGCCHSFTREVVTEATCLEEGTARYTCSECGSTFDRAIPAEHYYEFETIVEPTCTEYGSGRATCTVCGDTFTYELDLDDHHYSYETIKEATCTEEGMRKATCSVCGDSYTYSTGTKDHAYTSEVILEPTCTGMGERLYTCSVCGSTEISSIMPLGHEYGEDLRCIRCGENAPTEGTWGDNLTWTLADGVLTISGEGEMAEPGTLGDEDGEFLDYYMPWYNLPFEHLVIEEGVTSISYYAFAKMEQIRTVSLPDSLEKLSSQCFYACVNLTGPVVIPEGVTKIPSMCFQGCRSLDEIVLHDGITDMGGWYGLADTGLTSIHIPAGVDYLEYALANCDKLARITVSENNPYYAHDDQGALYSEDMTELVMVPPAYSGAFVIPEGVTCVDCPPMIDDSSSFSGCDQITEIYIPASLHNIYAQSLLSSKLTAIHVAEGNPSLFEVDGVLYGDVEAYYDMEGFNPEGVKRYLIRVPAAMNVGDFTVPEDVEVINPYTFQGCKYLDEVSIPAGCKVDLNAFQNSSVTAIRIAEGHAELFSDANGIVFNQDLTLWDYDFEIGDDVEIFYPAGTRLMIFPAGLTGFYAVPEGITSLADHCFDYGRIEAVRLPSTLTEFGNYALSGEQIKWVLFTGEKPEVGHDFCEDGRTVYYPGWLDSWSNPNLNWGEGTTYIPYEQGKEPSYGSNPFTDVVAGKFYYESVLWAVKNNITSGTTPTTFAPDDECTRGQVVTFLWRAAGSPDPKITSHPFTDVAPGKFYYKAMLWAVEKGITSGITPTSFGPEVVCDRGTVVTFLHRALGKQEPISTTNPFTDVAPGKFYYKAVLWAVENNITSGVGGSHFAPTDSCNRGQVVTFLHRAYGNQ